MIFRSLGIYGRKRAGLGEFFPTDISGLQLWGKWNDSTTLTKDGSNYVSAFVDQSDNGVTYTQGTGADQPQWQSGNLFYFDGASDNYPLDDLLTYTSTDTQATIFLPVKPVDATPVGNRRFMCIADTSAAASYIIIDYLGTTGLLRCQQTINGVIKWVLQTDANPFSDNTLAIITLKQDGVSPVIYVDNVAPAQTFTTSADKTTWIADDVNLDNVRLSVLYYNGGSSSGFFNGSIGVPLYYNSALSDADRTSVYDYLNSIYS